MKALKAPVLYAITDEVLTPPKTIVKQAEIALKNGVQILQYRNKTQSDEEVFDICKKLFQICKEHGAMFIINDRVDLATDLNTHGLHIGKEDTSFKEAKRQFSGYIGVSCYADVQRAKKMIELGAHYVAFGSFFLSPTKPNSKKVELNVLEKAKSLNTKIAVIGGINQQNIIQFAPYKVDMFCAISSIFKGDIEKNTKALKEKVLYLQKENYA